MLTVSYSDYLEKYSKQPAEPIPEECFFAYLEKAEAMLSALTMGTLDKAPEEMVCACACELAEVLYLHTLRRGIRSENNDGYSVSYDPICIEKVASELALCYLAPAGCLYRGIG